MSAPRRHVYTAEQDAALRAVYQNHRPGLITRLSLEWDIPCGCLNYRATRILKLAPTRRAPQARSWTAAEDQLLIRYGHLPWKPLQAKLAAAGFARSAYAVLFRRTALRARGEPVGQERDTLTTAEVAEGLGCSIKTVDLWIARGWLKATALTPDSPAKRYQITEAALRTFCLHHTGALLNYRPDLTWYTDLIGRPIGQRAAP